jgi:hypothetical protein
MESRAGSPGPGAVDGTGGMEVVGGVLGSNEPYDFFAEMGLVCQPGFDDYNS